MESCPGEVGQGEVRQSMKLLRSRRTAGAGRAAATVAAGTETIGPSWVESCSADEEDISVAAQEVGSDTKFENRFRVCVGSQPPRDQFIYMSTADTDYMYNTYGQLYNTVSKPYLTQCP